MRVNTTTGPVRITRKEFNSIPDAVNYALPDRKYRGVPSHKEPKYNKIGFGNRRQTRAENGIGAPKERGKHLQFVSMVDNEGHLRLDKAYDEQPLRKRLEIDRYHATGILPRTPLKTIKHVPGEELNDAKFVALEEARAEVRIARKLFDIAVANGENVSAAKRNLYEMMKNLDELQRNY